MKAHRWILGLGIACVFWGLSVQQTAAAPELNSISDNRTNYTNSQIPRYSKFEIHFQITNTTATNWQFPYDPNPPPGIALNQGISAEAEFSSDNWQTVYRQPAFYYQEYERQVKGGQDWIYPTGNAYWVVRFSPNTTGTWQYRLHVQDSSGIGESNASSFAVVASANHGRLQISPNDARYLDFEDGTYFPGLGYNLNFDQIDWKNPIQKNQTNFQVMDQNGIQFIRIWLSQWQIFGAQWNGWKYTGNGEATYLTMAESYGDSEVAMRVQVGNNPCMSSAHWLEAPIALKRNTTYRVKVRVKTQGLSGPVQAGKPYGFVVKTGQLSWLGNTCDDPDLGTRMTTALTNDSDWTTVEGTYDSGSRDYLEGIYLTLENLSSGTAYIDHVTMEENVGAWGSQPNILEQPSMAHHLYYDQRMSYAFDAALELAEQYHIYLKPVLTEKNDWILDRIAYDGSLNAPASNNNFYGNWRTMTKTRWLLQSWWRYVQARWGYSTSIAAWELLNEGDPWSGLHYTLADEFGKYMKCGVFDQPMQADNGWICNYNDPNSHPVTTSNWHSFPVTNFWKNTNYPNVDIADFHLYYQKTANSNMTTDVGTYTISTPATWYDTALVAKTQSDAVGALTYPVGAQKPTVIGESGFVDSGSAPASPELYQDTQGLWLHNYLWAGIGAGGVYNAGYWYSQASQIYCTNCSYNGQSYNYDHRPEFGNYYRFIQDIPLSNGHYVDAAAQSTNQTLRAWGQKDVFNNRAHLWLANPAHTWKNVLDHAAITPISATVTLSGFTPTTPLTVEWWDTYTGQPTTTQTLTTTSQGDLLLTVSNLTADTAVKIGNYASAPPITPTLTPTPSADFNGDGAIDFLDLFSFLPHFGQPDTVFKLVGSGLVSIFDFNQLISQW